MGPAVTKGSCWGWQGVVPYPGVVRALDVTLEGDRPSLVTIALEPVRDGESSEVEALLEWGTAQGSAHRAVIDVAAGQVLGLAASRVIVSLSNIGGGQAQPPAARMRASASVGGAAGSMPVLRAVRLGSLAALSVLEIEVPPFARTASLVRAPAGAGRVLWLGGGGQAVGEGIWKIDEGGSLLVPPGAVAAVLTNAGSVDWVDARAVFELAL